MINLLLDFSCNKKVSEKVLEEIKKTQFLNKNVFSENRDGYQIMLKNIAAYSKISPAAQELLIKHHSLRNCSKGPL